MLAVKRGGYTDSAHCPGRRELLFHRDSALIRLKVQILSSTDFHDGDWDLLSELPATIRELQVVMSHRFRPGFRNYMQS